MEEDYLSDGTALVNIYILVGKNIFKKLNEGEIGRACKMDLPGYYLQCHANYAQYAHTELLK